MEPEALLRGVARLAVVELADFCSVNRYEGEVLKRAEVAHAIGTLSDFEVRVDQAYHARITSETAIGEGTTFRIQFPRA